MRNCLEITKKLEARLNDDLLPYDLSYVYFTPSLSYDCFNEITVKIYMEQLAHIYKQIYCFLMSVPHLFTDTIMIGFLIKTVNFLSCTYTLNTGK
jgi:hypothetical protein